MLRHTSAILLSFATLLFLSSEPAEFGSTAHPTKVLAATAPPSTPGPTGCGGPTINLNPGMITPALQRAITNAPDCSLIVFAPGTYHITSQLSIPCRRTGMTITGPATGYPQNRKARPTAILLADYTQGDPLFKIQAPCAPAKGLTIEYLDFNGNRPATGGGSIYVSDGGYANLTIQYNYLHGNQEATPNACGDGGGWFCYDDQKATLLYLDGSNGDKGVMAGPADKNTKILYNIFGAYTGNPLTGDCSHVMQWIGNMLPNNKFLGYDQTGGFCAAIGVHISTAKLAIEYNVIQQQEQGMKFFQAGGDPNNFYQVDDVIEYNDISFYHRIAVETQNGPYRYTYGRANATTGTKSNCPGQPNNQCFVFDNNVVRDDYTPGFGNWGLSAPQGGYNNASDNVMISNNSQPGNKGAGPGDFEMWTNGSSSHNLEQGYIGCGLDWGYFDYPKQFPDFSYNKRQLIIATCATKYTGGDCTKPPGTGVVQGVQPEYNFPCKAYPTMQGNTFTNKVSAVVSTPPTLSPNSSTFSGSLDVTFTDLGNKSDAGPRGNTGIWYTTDGSTPQPGQGSAQYISSGGTIKLTKTTTVKAVGMWGAITQPTSYPTGYGFVPSPVVSASYTASGAKTPGR